MDDLDSRLPRAGDRWRRAQPPGRDPELLRSVFVASTRRTDRTVQVLGILVLVLFVGGVVTFVSMGRNGQAGRPSPAAALIVKVGDRVIVSGRIVAAKGQPILLCLPPTAIDLVGGLERPACQPPRVELQGIDPMNVPGARAVGGTVVIQMATLSGAWTGTAVDIDRWLSAAPKTGSESPVLGCGQPVPGAISGGPATPDTEAVYAQLQAEVEGHPDSYAGEWIQEIDGISTVVVGTVADRSRVERQLREIFPYGLCVVSADYSLTTLRSAAAAFTRPDQGWIAHVDVESNRVIVNLPVVDASAASALDAAPGVMVEPLVAPETSG